MSNVDLSRLVTSEDKTARAMRDHAILVKAECRRRILTLMPLEAQQNIVQAVTAYSAGFQRGSGGLEADADARLKDGDLALVHSCWRWIAAMQSASRALSADLSADPRADAAWPALPSGARGLVARF